MLKSLVVLENPVEGSRIKFQILSHAKYYDDEGIIELKFHDEMRPLLLRLQQHFTQIPLDVFLRLKSGYAMKMYVRVRSWNPQDSRNHLQSWEMDVEQVRGFFGLDKGEYKEPKFIAAGVLKRAMRELNERADLTFRYEPIKETRKLVGWVLGPFPIRRQLRYQPEQRRLNARANCANFRHTSGLLTKRAGEMDECHSGKP
jgi:plasmid replication initiation protein